MISIAYEGKENFSIYFSVNIKNVTEITNDYSETSLLTEFLSLNELDQLLKASNKFGFYSKVFFETNDTFNRILQKDSSDKVIVFEFSQKGTGMAKDSLIPSFCELNNIIYTGSNAYTNAIYSNKYLLYNILNSFNISAPKSYVFKKSKNWLFNNKPKSFYNLFSKPISECASIGINKNSKTNTESELKHLLDRNVNIYKQDFIVQEYIFGKEIEVPFIVKGNKYIILPAIGISIDKNENLGNEFLDFDRVENDNYDFYLFEDAILMEKIKEDIIKILMLLDFTGYGRIDLRIDDEKNYFFTDINSYPHIVKHSSFSKSLISLGYNDLDAVPILIGNAIYNSNNRTNFEAR